MFKNTKKWFSFIYFFPILLVLTACNDSNNDQVSTKPDNSKKPVMRCAP